MATVVRAFAQRLETTHGVRYRVLACGRQRADGTWEGWIEFQPDDGTAALHTPRETTQPNLGALEYWASGLTPVYLEGALERAVDAHTDSVDVVEQAVHDEPAPPRAAREPASDTVMADAVLDPFALYAKGEGLLRERLGALGERHLRGILTAYQLVEDTITLEALGQAELIELTVVAVRTRLAA